MNKAKWHITSCSDRPMQSFTHWVLVLHCPCSPRSPHTRTSHDLQVTNGHFTMKYSLHFRNSKLSFFSTCTMAALPLCQASVPSCLAPCICRYHQHICVLPSVTTLHRHSSVWKASETLLAVFPPVFLKLFLL